MGRPSKYPVEVRERAVRPARDRIRLNEAALPSTGAF
jgi:hypothetical protein